MLSDIIAVDKLQSHRNGVDGKGFYSCIATLKNGTRNEGGFLITFETDEKDIDVIVNNCRVIKLSNVTSNWRGDDFARWLNSFFRQGRENSELNSIYDFYKSFKSDNRESKKKVV